MSDELVVVDHEEKYLSVAEIKTQMAFVHEILRDVLIEGVVKNGVIVKDGHYGKLPGCGDKPTLFKPGAEKLCLAFNLVPKYKIDIREIPEDAITPPGHRDYRVTCELYNRMNGNFVGQGLGSCSTMEGKYRYRTKWVNKKPEKEENQCIADIYNTVHKMACKRAFVHAVIQCLAVSDIFMQDVEDMKDDDINGYKPKPPMSPPKSKSEPPKDGKITPPQMKKIQVMFNDIFPGFGSDEKRQVVSRAIKREISSMTNLSLDEAKALIDHLQELQKMKDETGT